MSRLADGLEQCSHKDESPKLVIEAMRCAKQLLFTLHNVSYGHGLSQELAEKILDKYKLLTDTDYQGTSTDIRQRPSFSYSASVTSYCYLVHLNFMVAKVVSVCFH